MHFHKYSANIKVNKHISDSGRMFAFQDTLACCVSFVSQETCHFPNYHLRTNRLKNERLVYIAHRYCTFLLYQIIPSISLHNR
jgi:hypothetical protein